MDEPPVSIPCTGRGPWMDLKEKKKKKQEKKKKVVGESFVQSGGPLSGKFCRFWAVSVATHARTHWHRGGPRASLRPPRFVNKSL